MVGDARPAGKGWAKPRAEEQIAPEKGDARGRRAEPQALSAADPHAPSPLPAELLAFIGHLSQAELDAAALRARHIGVGADQVLVAGGRVEPAEATGRLAAHLGLAIAPPGSGSAPGDAATAEAMLRTGVRVDAADGARPRFTLAARGRDVRRLIRALRRDPGLAGRVRLAEPGAFRREVMAAAGPLLAASAAARLATRHPLKSAATLDTKRALGRVALAVGLPFLALLALAPEHGLLLVQALLSLVFLGWVSIRLASCAYDPPADPTPALPVRQLPVYSVLVPLYREAASVPHLVAALGALDYPPEKLDIKLVVEADDDATRAAIAAIALPVHMEEVPVPAIGPRTKPKALAVALAAARGSFVAVYDAEDLPEPDQLRRALEAFRQGGPNVACVQARLAADNADDSWIAASFAAEYAAQFDVLLPMLSALGLPILLGGTSNHFRRRVLDEVGGWDPFNVTEDADLGIRLARAGWQTRVIASTTFEEAPVTPRAWLGQRTRWLKGWAQTLLVHLRQPRALMEDLGTGPALALLVLAAGPFAAALVHPFCVALLLADLVRGVIGLPRGSLAEVLTSALTFTTLFAGYAGTAATAFVGLRRRARMPGLKVVLGIPFYWMLLSAAAWRALVELLRRPHHWQKTEHGVARHRVAQAAALRRSGSMGVAKRLPAGPAHAAAAKA
ncbi:glycosyltransferase [Xanthobacter autotrophicus]|uniref:glycosyltransferase n=1 Tax=Xanthobacter TaxID=279 RepID=UPI0024ABA871|nr:glycosyltransferase [Xanthobacter autotrophicus]MDI4666571.1 glycosyltransferase [Xanthobacter autotrophicus]